MAKSNRPEADVVEVKAWATEAGLPIGGSRGRLPNATIEAFEAATGSRYMVIDHSPVVTRRVIVTTPKGGKRPQAVTFLASEARTGDLVGKRGRVPEVALAAHAAKLVAAKGLTVA